MSDENESEDEYKEESYYRKEKQSVDKKYKRRDSFDSSSDDSSNVHGEEEWYEGEEEGEDEYEEEKKDETVDKEKDKKSMRRVMFEEPSLSFDESIESIETPIERRKTMYELDAFTALEMVARDMDDGEARETESEGGEEELIKRWSETLGIPGVMRIDLSPLSQKIVGCVIDEHVTTEFPWVYVKKEIIEDNIDLHSESSDFLPIKDDIERYKGDRILLGYAPNQNEDEGQFYICLTKEGRDGVARSIETLRREQEAKVYKAVCKIPRPKDWKHQGSAEIVNRMTVKKSRPLFEIEVESSANQLSTPVILTDRGCDDQRDGYVEVIPYRESFDNISKHLVDKEVTVLPIIKENEAQTPVENLVNSACQCLLDQEPMELETNLNPIQQRKILTAFLQSRTNEMCQQIQANETWDVYANDYAKLAEQIDSNLIESSSKTEYSERQSYYDGRLVCSRVINDLSWHPLWTGIAVVCYTPASKSETLVGVNTQKYESTNEDNQVLVWSFDDCLAPKLILETKRRVTAVSFCPYNGNIVIGGCSNGQIVIWDIAGKIEEVETHIVKTASETKYETIIRGLGKWMKESRGSWIIRPTAMSSLQNSQKGPITKIEWLSPYHKLNDRGILESLPEDTSEDNLSLQFIASSEDGSIAFWDLNWRPSEDAKAEAKKKKRQVKKPDSLMQSISPYKALDNVFKPLYMLICQYPNESRNAIITAMTLRRPYFRKEQIQSKICPINNMTQRRCYRIIIEKDEEDEIPDGIFVGTAKGECAFVSWEGFEFSTGVSMNSEMVKWVWKKQVHDGPICHAVRSRHLKNVVLTVGGRIFAIWREDFGEPLLWRKSEYRYTACCWDSNKPSVIILGRNDGTVEIWDIFIKSHESNITQSLSGRIITGIYAHELPLNPQCVGFCDYNGALRIFLAPKVSTGCADSDVKWMRQFIDREVERIKEFIEWQKNWIETNLKETEDETQRAEAAPKQTEAEAQLAQETMEKEAVKQAKTRARKRMVEQMRARWVTRELNRMERAILAQKGLREEDMERRIKPVLQMKKDKAEKEAKKRGVFEKADEIFEEALSTNFPQQKHKLLKATSLPTAGPDRGDMTVLETSAVGDYKTKEDEIVQNFEELESEAMSSMVRRSYDMAFSWRNLIEEGIKRRQSLDIKLKRHMIKVEKDRESTIVSNFESLEALDDAESNASIVE